jgi:hypothetical protein
MKKTIVYLCLALLISVGLSCAPAQKKTAQLEGEPKRSDLALEVNPLSTPARPVIPGVDDQITVRNMSVHLPAGTGWTIRVIPMPREGRLYEFERDLPNGSRMQIHIADYSGPAGAREYERGVSNMNDAQRLESLIRALESVPEPLVRRSEWVTTVRRPQRSFGAVCRERHDARQERKEGAGRFLWKDWMLFCVDPVSRIPIQIDYAERYPVGGVPSPSFAEDAAAFFDSVEFRPAAK